MERSGARSIDARSAHLDRSGVVSLNAERAVLHDASAVLLRAREARVVKSRVLLLTADQTHLEGGSRAVISLTRGQATTAGAVGILAALAALALRLTTGRRAR